VCVCVVRWVYDLSAMNMKWRENAFRLHAEGGTVN